MEGRDTPAIIDPADPARGKRRGIREINLAPAAGGDPGDPPPGNPSADGGAGAGLPFDAVLTSPCARSGDCGHVWWLRRHYPRLPIPVIGMDDPDLAVAAFDAGADVVLKRPVHPQVAAVLIPTVFLGWRAVQVRFDDSIEALVPAGQDDHDELQVSPGARGPRHELPSTLALARQRRRP